MTGKSNIDLTQVPGKPENIKVKTGLLNKKEKQYIAEYYKFESVEVIAERLNRYPSDIKKFVNELENEEKRNYLPPNVKNILDINLSPAGQLRKKPEWEQLKTQFSKKELHYFEHKYNLLVGQFNNNVLPTEEMQIINLIRFEILMNRNMTEKKKIQIDTIKLRKGIQDLRDSVDNKVSKLSTMEKNLLLQLEESLTAIRSVSDSKSQEYIKLESEYDKGLKSLNASRGQRIKDIESKGESFIGLMKTLQEEEFRQNEGIMLTKVNMAVAKERERLTNYQDFVDGADQPILSSETIKPDYNQ